MEPRLRDNGIGIAYVTSTRSFKVINGTKPKPIGPMQLFSWSVSEILPIAYFCAKIQFSIAHPYFIWNFGESPWSWTVDRRFFGIFALPDSIRRLWRKRYV